MRTEVKLDNIYYKLQGLPVQTLANQMASKVGQGTSEYADLTSWSAWIQQDWQPGVSKSKPHLQGGFLYGEADSRVPGQLILPPLLRWVDTRDINNTASDCRYTPSAFAGSITVGSGGYQRAAMKLTTPATLPYQSASEAVNLYFWLYADVPPDVELTFALYSDSSGPSAVVSSGTYTPEESTRGYQWHGRTLSVDDSTTYWLVVYPTDSGESFTWATGSSGYDTAVRSYNGTSWSTVAGTYALFSSECHAAVTTGANTGTALFRFNGSLYSVQNLDIWKYDTTNDEWNKVSDLVDGLDSIYSVSGGTPFGTTVYFGSGGLLTDRYMTMNSSEVVDFPGTDGNIFHRTQSGYLWRSQNNILEYTANGTTWEPTTSLGETVYVSSSEFPVTGMCELGDILYVATPAGLVGVYPGDIARPILQWGGYSVDNGTNMVAFEGALYMTVNGRVVRFTPDGTLQDVWMNRDDDLIQARIGKVWGLCVMNNWLIAYVNGTTTSSKPTLWAYQGNAWHHLATLPNTIYTSDLAYSDYSIFYDRPTQKLWVVAPRGMSYNWRVADFTLNPYNDASSLYQRSAWVEWDWFDGPVLEAEKDYESVTIIGENLDATCSVKVYWQDDASTGWELLGTATSNISELRWSDSATRPNTKRLKLAVLLQSSDSSQTPRVRAIRVKYHLMVKDWFRWNLTLDVSGRTDALQMTADGTRHTLTSSQIKDNIDALCQRVPPFIYQDVDTTQYEVKIVDGNFRYTKWEHNESTGDTYFEGIYSLVIEQVTSGEYTA